MARISDNGALTARATLTREDWVLEARKVLESLGIARVKVDQLARVLGVTRGSFYFHFKDAADLQESLLANWVDSNCRPFADLAADAGLGGRDIIEAVNDLWLGQGTFRAALDLAVRDWGKSSPEVLARMASADDARIDLLVRGFADLGFGVDEALVRAQIAYFHQVGYFTVQVKEPLTRRLDLFSVYLKVLTNIDDWKDRSGGVSR